MTALDKADLKEALGKVKTRVHVHNVPKCSGDTHDAKCAGKGTELSCNQVSVTLPGGKKIKKAVCVHVAF